MSKFLSEIINLKRNRLIEAKKKTSLAELKNEAFKIRENSENHRLSKILQDKSKTNIIAEIKRASPSKGIINDKINVCATARIYEKGGACAISVLTEEDKFGGRLNDLEIVKNCVKLPVLRKDFIFDEFQIYESARAGADVILLIAAMLDPEIMQKFYRLADDLGLDVLVEIHTVEELQRVKQFGPKIIGINNRDLNSFKVSLNVSRELIKHMPQDTSAVSESGISTADEIAELKDSGFSGFLIGETLMRSSDAAVDLRKLKI